MKLIRLFLPYDVILSFVASKIEIKSKRAKNEANSTKVKGVTISTISFSIENFSEVKCSHIIHNGKLNGYIF